MTAPESILDDDRTWRRLAEVDDLPVQGELRGLLAVTGSLTSRLRALCGDAFRLNVIGERERGGSMVREVLMCCGDIPWVFAQTIVPAATLAANGWLARLGETPLGDALFERDDVRRGEIRLGRVDRDERLYRRAVQCLGHDDSSHALWARRSSFWIGADELLVNEVFLPDFGRCV